MPSKRKTNTSSPPRRIYTTRQIMELTEERRRKEDALRVEVELKLKAQAQSKMPHAVVDDVKLVPVLLETVSPQVAEEVKAFVTQVNTRPPQDEIERPVEAIPQESRQQSSFQKPRPLIFVVLIAVILLTVYLNFPESLIMQISSRINDVVILGSAVILNILQGANTVQGNVLNVYYYRVTLQGDLIAFYSLELLIVFTTLFAFIQKTSWIKRSIVFISLAPLAVGANIFRVLMACGIALNDGGVMADRFFYGYLVVFVFVFVVLGLFFLEFLNSPD